MLVRGKFFFKSGYVGHDKERSPSDHLIHSVRPVIRRVYAIPDHDLNGCAESVQLKSREYSVGRPLPNPLKISPYRSHEILHHLPSVRPESLVVLSDKTDIHGKQTAPACDNRLFLVNL